MVPPDWLKAFVAIGEIHRDREFLATGAGVILHSPPLLWLATARHNLARESAHPVVALFPQRGRGFVVLDCTRMHAENGIRWVKDEAADIAVTPLPAHAQADIKAVGRHLCIGMAEVFPSMGAYTVGCPYGVRSVDPAKATPLVLGGIVSGVAEQESIIFTSAPTFPGNSGGPLLVAREPFSAEGAIHVGRPTILLAGIMREMALIRSDRDSLPALHLGTAVSMDRVWALIESEAAREVVSRLPLGGSGAVTGEQPA